MNKVVIIIPSRLEASRLPNKPLKLINNKEMILHVYEAAMNSKSGEVYVATPNQKIIEIIKKNGGNAVKTSTNHETGTDRVFEVFDNILGKKPNIILNVQGDMPNIDPQAISKLVKFMQSNKCDIGTLASNFRSEKELGNSNIVKVEVNGVLSSDKFLQALDFFRDKKETKNNLYHHVGIYAYTNEALVKYVKFKRSKLELERRLEQLRALENNMSIHVGYIKTSPLSVDTEEDLIEVKKLIEKDEKK